MGFRAAATLLWGEAGLKELGALLPDEARQATLDPIVLSGEWLPERYVMAWYEAAWHGPAKRDNGAYTAFIDGMMDNGFGRVRKVFLGFATAEMIMNKAGDLWHHDHTTGKLTVQVGPGKTANWTLTNHIYTTTPLARLSIAEVYRYAAALSRAKNVVATHSVKGPDELLIKMTWE